MPAAKLVNRLGVLHRPEWGMLHTSIAPLPMRYTTMGYTSTALYFYKQFTQAPNKFF